MTDGVMVAILMILRNKNSFCEDMEMLHGAEESLDKMEVDYITIQSIEYLLWYGRSSRCSC